MKNNKWSLFLAIKGFIIMIVVNSLANLLPINGLQTGEVSSNYSNLFTPTGFTFSIWGVIYFSLGIFLFYFLKNRISFRVSFHFFITCILNATWILLWHYEEIILSFLVISGLLVELINIYILLDINYRDFDRRSITLFFPFSIYTGWLSVATLANLTVVLVYLNSLIFIEFQEISVIILLFIGMSVGCFILYKRNDIFYTLVIIWAYIGILYKLVYESDVVYYRLKFFLGFSIVFLTILVIKKIFKLKINR